MGSQYIKVKVPPGIKSSSTLGVISVSKLKSQRLCIDSSCGHVASMTRCLSAQNAVTFPPKWYLFINLHLHAFELLGWQDLGQATGAHYCMDLNCQPCGQQACHFSGLTCHATASLPQYIKKTQNRHHQQLCWDNQGELLFSAKHKRITT